MRIVKENSPNIEELKLFFPIDGNQYFPFGDKLYNPSGEEIPPDILHHEGIHSKQQGDNSMWWWHEYIINRDFRLKQEVEAYAKQYLFVKKLYKNKGVKEALEEFAENLSSPLYRLGITRSHAETLIRYKAKMMVLKDGDDNYT